MARVNHPDPTEAALSCSLNFQGAEHNCRQSCLSIPQSRPLWVCIFDKHTQLLFVSNWKWSVARRRCRAVTGPLTPTYCSPGCTVSLVKSFPSSACIALTNAVRCSGGNVFNDSCRISNLAAIFNATSQYYRRSAAQALISPLAHVEAHVSDRQS